MGLTGDDWELCNDDGFVYKRKKRRLDDPPPSLPSANQAPDPEAEERHRRERKRKALLKLKKQYQKDIDRWEHLSNTLCAMQDKAKQQRPQKFEEPAALVGSALELVQESEMCNGSLVDELLLQAEAQEAIIHDISNLCDVAEAMCSAQEEQLKQSLIDLPVWDSPDELMAALCEE